MATLSKSIRFRLAATLGFMVLVALGIGVLGLRTGSSMLNALEFVHADRLRPAAWIGEINSRQRDVLMGLHTATNSRSPAKVEQLIAAAEEHEARIQALWAQYQTTRFTEEETQLAADFWRLRERLLTVHSSVLSDLSSGQFDAANDKLERMVPEVFSPMISKADQLLALQLTVAEAAVDEAQAAHTREQTIVIGIVVLSGLLAAALAWALVRTIGEGLRAASSIADAISNGQLGNPIASHQENEIGLLLQSLRAMDGKLVEIVGGVRHAADAVGGAASQLSRGNDDLSQRTQEQASALEQTASSMEEMTATVKQNADNARQANQLASSARGQAEIGSEVVARAVSAMAEINQASRKIAEIIGVIDEIAFQTNLLALNAAVEAARAGEQGRGFAVVASEVRSLAQRSAAAAKEIKDLIGESVEKVRSGTELVDQSGNVLAQIMGSVKKVSDIVAEITAASEEQAQGIDQVNGAVTQMDHMTQQNAALVEEAASAAKSMEQQAHQLVEQISFFHRNERHSGTRPEELATPMRNLSAHARKVRTLDTTAKRPPAHSPLLVRVEPAPVPTQISKVSGGDGAWSEF